MTILTFPRLAFFYCLLTSDVLFGFSGTESLTTSFHLLSVIFNGNLEVDMYFIKLLYVGKPVNINVGWRCFDGTQQEATECSNEAHEHLYYDNLEERN
jgi:hypothetical protein